MAITVAELEARLTAVDRGFNKAMRGATTTTERLAKAAGIAGIAIATGLAVAFKVGMSELIDSQKVMAQTEAVIESTGGAANVTAEHVDELAQELLQLSGVDDEVIASGENLLLTFRNIHNEVGAGNDIFDQATKATLDLSIAMGKDMNDSAILVGKALNDPIRGMTALRRVGVTLSEGQEKLVTKLVESGDVMGAQKIILKELTKEFGGSAKAAGETLPAKLSKAREAFADISAEVVEALLPAITTMLEKFADWLGVLKEHPALVKVMVAGLAALSAALIIASAHQLALNLAVLANPYVAASVAIIAYIALLVVLYKKFDFVRKHWHLLLFAFGLLPGIVAIAVRQAINHWDSLRGAVMAVKDAVVTAWNVVRTITQTVWSNAAAMVRDKIALMKSAFAAVKSVAVSTWNAIAAAIQPVISAIQTVIGWINTLIGKIQSIPTPGDIVGGIAGHIPGLATGGDITRQGVAFLHAGERVLPAAQVAARGAGGGGGTMQVNLHLGGRQIASALVDLDQRQKRQGGRGFL